MVFEGHLVGTGLKVGVVVDVLTNLLQVSYLAAL